MEEELVCNNCGWTGDSTMLVSLTDDIEDEDYNYCPECESGDLEDLEE